MSRTMRPPAPIRMPFWDSVSVQMAARTVTSFGPSSISSTCTSTACGTSWRVRRSTCSRTISASQTSSRRSETSSSAKKNGPSGSRATRWSSSDCTPVPRAAEMGKISASRPNSASSSAAPCSARTMCGLSSRSALLTAIVTGVPVPDSASAMKRSPGPPTPWTPSTTKRTASQSASSCSTRRCMRDVSMSRGTACQSPGRVATPRIARRVVCGLSETIATFWPTIALTSVDLPTLGRPASAMKPDRVIAPIRGSPPAAPASRRRRSHDPCP